MTTLNTDDLTAVPPQTVADYLTSTGWVHTGEYVRTAIFSRGESSVFVPDSTDLRDYPARMNELMRTLAAVENRPSIDILGELRFPRRDVQYVRTTPDTPSGTTPLGDGLKALQGLRALYMEAARSAATTDAPEVTSPSRSKDPATPFLNHVRLGTPMAGSFVFRIETPLEIADTTAKSPRDVLMHLYQLVSSVRRCAAESADVGNARPFESGISDGVNANLCTALSDVAGSTNNPFEFRFDWSWSAPEPDRADPLTFDRPQVESLRYGAQHLRRLTTVGAASARGMVSSLARRTAGSGGRATLTEADISIGDEHHEHQRVVLKNTSSNDYDRLVWAHRESRTVRVEGVAKLVGRQWEIDNPRAVEA